MNEILVILEGIILFFITASFKWLITLEKRVSKLEAKIDELCRLINNRR